METENLVTEAEVMIMIRKELEFFAKLLGPMLIVVIGLVVAIANFWVSQVGDLTNSMHTLKLSNQKIEARLDYISKKVGE